MKLLRSIDTKQIDKQTIEKQGITTVILIERAATALYNEIINRWSLETPFVIFAGPGNNGADALALSILLIRAGYNVKTFLFCPNKELSEACTHFREQLANEPMADFYEVLAEFKPPVLTTRTVIIDGLFGSGLNKPLTGGFAGIVKYINSTPSYKLSIDIPSGLFGENNTDNDPNAIIESDLTLCFQQPKIVFFLRDSVKYVKEYKVLNIDLDSEAIQNCDSTFYQISEIEVSAILRERAKFSHKGDYGHGLLVAGKLGMMGAAQLSAKAAYRSGIGLLTIHAPKIANAIIQSSVPEAIYSPDASQTCFSQAPFTETYSNVAVGPGIGTEKETCMALSQLLQRRGKPMVIDADALNIIAQHKNLLNQIPEGSILTPHPKEFDRIMGESTSAYSRLEKAIKLAKQFRLVVVLKGAYTATVIPNGNVFFNTSGNPGMATAGSGDVLTGIILSLLCQGYNPVEAAIAGNYIHGVAGDKAANELTQFCMNASDIINYLPKAFAELILTEDE
ncbi:MAG: NAD(P)H-hydrate dehydratase [Bacteroidales bacterium]